MCECKCETDAVATPRSPLMSAAVKDFVLAGVLRPGRPQSCYRLVPVPKSDTTDVSDDLLFIVAYASHAAPAMPASICGARVGAGRGRLRGIKLDLRDGFYHIPLAECTMNKFGVDYAFCITYTKVDARETCRSCA